MATFTLIHHTPDGEHVTLGTYPEFRMALAEIEGLADVNDHYGAQLTVDHEKRTASLKVTALEQTSYWTVKPT
jgi:hypothetical protein